jgi:cyanate permease
MRFSTLPALADIFCSVLMYLGIVNTGYGGSFFTPTILNQLGPKWTPVRSQVMSIPIYIVATVMALTTAFLTDRLKHRFSFIIIGCCIATVGYAILLSMKHVPVGARYLALFFITGGGKSSFILQQRSNPADSF